MRTLVEYANRQESPKRILANVLSHRTFPDGCLVESDDYSFIAEQIEQYLMPFQSQFLTYSFASTRVL